jgi:hypothetical protein
MSANGFKWKGRNTSVICVFFDQMCTTLLICISNYAISCVNAYKCHIINFLLTSLAWTLQRNIEPRPRGSVCTKKTSVRYFSVKTSRSVNKLKITLLMRISFWNVILYFKILGKTLVKIFRTNLELIISLVKCAGYFNPFGTWPVCMSPWFLGQLTWVVWNIFVLWVFLSHLISSLARG